MHQFVIIIIVATIIDVSISTKLSDKSTKIAENGNKSMNTNVSTAHRHRHSNRRLSDNDRNMLNREFLKLIKNLSLINRKENEMIRKYLRTKSTSSSSTPVTPNRRQRSLGSAVVESRNLFSK